MIHVCTLYVSMILCSFFIMYKSIECVTEKTGSGSKEITCPDHDRGGPIQILGEKPEAVQPYGSDPGREL